MLVDGRELFVRRELGECPRRFFLLSSRLRDVLPRRSATSPSLPMMKTPRDVTSDAVRKMRKKPKEATGRKVEAFVTANAI